MGQLMIRPTRPSITPLTRIGALIPGLALIGAIILALMAPDAPVVDQPMITRDEPVQMDASLHHVKS